MEQTNAVGKQMQQFVLTINSKIEAAGIDAAEFSVSYEPASEDTHEDVKWHFERDDDKNGNYFDFTEKGYSVIEHKLEDMGNLLTPAQKTIFLEFEPQLAVLRELLNLQNHVARIAERVVVNATRL